MKGNGRWEYLVKMLLCRMNSYECIIYAYVRMLLQSENFSFFEGTRDIGHDVTQCCLPLFFK